MHLSLPGPRPFVLWWGVFLLVTIGVAAALGRGVYTADFATRAEPLRRHLLRSLHREDPLAPYRAAELREFDRPFAAHPVLTVLHVLPGGLFLLLAPLQFSARVRSRYLQLHRWSGRVLLLAGFVAALPALYFGLLTPYGGPGEAVAIGLFGGLFLAALGRAFLAIRRGQVAQHREWMIRAFATAIGISTIRLVGAVLDVALLPAGLSARTIFVLSLWTGWVVTLGAAELWIRRTRPRPVSAAAPAGPSFAGGDPA